jgi:hypothetical protein
LEIAAPQILEYFLGIKTQSYEILEEFPQETVSLRSTDFPLHIRNAQGTESILLLELQSYWKEEKVRDLIQYKMRFHNKYNLPIQSCMILFNENANATDVYTDGEISFSFTLIKLWQLDPAGILQKDQIQLLPFVPLMKNGVNYVDNIEKRIYTDSIELGLKSDLLTALTFFAGMRDTSVAATLLKRRRDLMIESPVYDMIKEEGLEQGKFDAARRMKEEGLPNDLISRVTGLSVVEIEGI